MVSGLAHIKPCLTLPLNLSEHSWMMHCTHAYALEVYFHTGASVPHLEHVTVCTGCQCAVRLH